MLRTLTMGIIALAAIAGVLALVLSIGLLRVRLADRGGPVTQVISPATHPSVAPPVVPPVESKPDPLPTVSTASIELSAEKAKLTGALKLDPDAPVERPHKRKKPGAPPDPPPAVRQAIVGFQGEGDAAEWSTKVSKSGLYEVDVVYAAPGPLDKTDSCVLTIGDQELHADTTNTRGGRQNYQVLTAGNLNLIAGNVTVRFRLAEKTRTGLLRLRSIQLIPAT